MSLPVTIHRRRRVATTGAAPNGESRLGLTEMRIGLRIKHARMTKGLRLKDVSQRADCSESMLSKVENGRVLPSLHALHRITDALGMTVGELFSGSNEPDRVVSKAGERPVVMLDPLRRGTGLQLERITPYGRGHLLQGNIHIVAPGGGSDGLIQHSGEEVGYVLEGRIKLTIGDHSYIVETGDSFCFRSELPHGYRNIGDVRARVLFVNTPPTF